jgi:hypothetical protein
VTVLLRLIVWLVLAASAFAAGMDGLGFLESGEYAPIPLGQVWASIHRDSLLLVEPALVRHVHPALWEDVVFPLLQMPAAAVGAVVGLGLFVATRGSTPRRRRRPDWR